MVVVVTAVVTVTETVTVGLSQIVWVLTGQSRGPIRDSGVNMYDQSENLS